MSEELFLTREQSRQIDRQAIDAYGISSLVLMENAGRGAVDLLDRLGNAGPVVILCGKGNNAGDGFVMARHLDIRRCACRVVLVPPAEELTGDARSNFEILAKTDVPIVELADVAEQDEQLVARLDDASADADWLVDALLGTGAQGDPRAPLDTIINWYNTQRSHKLAVDVPSGLDCDTGEPGQPTIKADHTGTFVAMKQGYLTDMAREHTGQVHVLDIGAPPQLLRDVLGRR